jgi:hypothetical protein
MIERNKTMKSKNRLGNRALNTFGLLSNGSPSDKKVTYAVVLTTVAISVVAAALIFPPATRAQDGDEITTSEDHEFKTFTVEVTQHLKSNAQNDVDPAEGQTLFSRGDTFIVNGSIYPDGSIPSGIAEPDPNARIIGKYRLRGTFTGNTEAFTRSIAGDPASPRIIAFATESFSLPDDDSTILTDGIWPNARKSAYRVVLGGTGRFSAVVGEIFEENIGENHDGFCNSRVTFKIRKALVRHEH